MAKERAAAEGVEEREVSDGSVEEISEEDFRHEGTGRSARVWGNVQIPRYLSRNHVFSSLAWMQAVQNKPLGGYGFGDSATVAPGPDTQVAEKPEVCLVLDSGDEDAGMEEKEEGELEEGEIDDVVVEGAEAPLDVMEVVEEGVGDLDSGGLEDEENGSADASDMTGVENSIADVESEEFEVEMDEPEDFDQRVCLVLEDLDTITEEEVEKSFDGACSQLLRATGRLQKMVSEGHGTFLEAIVQQAFTSVGIIHSVYLRTKEKNTDVCARFLLRMKKLRSDTFTTEQIKEINDMVSSLESERMAKTNVPPPISRVVDITRNNPSLKVKLPGIKPIVVKNTKEVSSLLDPLANHDEDSLPSPTREAGPPIPQTGPPIPQTAFVNQNVPQAAPRKRQPDNMLQPYVTDALKAVSCYHKKYDRISFLSSERLPSPTPSEDADNGDGDVHGEVSSILKTSISSIPLNPSVSTSSSRGSYGDSSSGQGPGPWSSVNQTSYGSKPIGKASAKSRDPRLKLPNPNAASMPQSDKQSMAIVPEESKVGPFPGPTLDPRKHKAVAGPSYGDQPLKRQKNEFVNSKEPQLPGRGGWLEDNGTTTVLSVNTNEPMGRVGVENKKPENAVNSWGTGQDTTRGLGIANVGINQVQPVSSVKDISLPSILKDLVVNPTMLMHLIREQQQKLAAENKQTSDASQLTVNKPIVQVSSAGNMPLKNSHDQNQDGKTSVPSEKSSSMSPQNPQNDAGKVRMKPRDPRRILHNSVIQKSEPSVSQRLKANGVSPFTHDRSDTASVRDSGEKAQTSGLPHLSSTATDITPQFSKNIKSISAIVSAPQTTGGLPAASLLNTQSSSSKMDDVIAKVVGQGDLHRQSSLSIERTSDASHSPDPWGDVDHLLDGYDEQQRAVIQKERARRIEEQNKMFAAKKLSLVLDLDHTLLNSAKFTEVDQIHEDILRKKEEVDRERPQRHLFRFQHMGMWTKLRPGIWNFLEKASKLYELHLYTMGNHSYATEMAKVLDPTGDLFGGRVISKGDENDLLDGDERVPKTKDLEGVKGMESAILIIDDSVKVWPHNRLNLIVVERYTFFPCSRRQFGLLGPSLLEIDHDERPEDGTLASSLAVIERIHQIFFSHPSLNNVDVRNILATEQRKILAGCRIVFSRIFPVGEANPHLHPLWQTAEQFGASCTNQLDEQVTHVVANSLGTDKVNWALSTGRYVVHHGWVEASALLYRRANEHDFAVKP